MKSARFVLVCLAASCIGVIPTQAMAGIVTFNQLTGGAPPIFSSGGFDFALVGLSSQVTAMQPCFPYCPQNGTSIVLAPFGPSSLTMTRSGGGTFSLIGFDGGGSFNFNMG